MCLNLNQMLHSNVFQPKTNVCSLIWCPLFGIDCDGPSLMNGRSNKTFSIFYSELPSMKELPPLPSRITNRPGYSNSDLNQIDINIMVDSSKPQARPTSRFGYDFVQSYRGGLGDPALVESMIAITWFTPT